jgi:hypothetical protein
LRPAASLAGTFLFSRSGQSSSAGSGSDHGALEKDSSGKLSLCHVHPPANSTLMPQVYTKLKSHAQNA